MRKYLVICFILPLSICCKKAEVKGIFGKWEKRGMVYSMRGYTSYNAGNSDIFEFNKDSTYKKYIKGKLFKKGTFHIKKQSQSGEDFTGIMYFNNDKYDISLITLSNNTLNIGEMAFDGKVVDYERIRD